MTVKLDHNTIKLAVINSKESIKDIAQRAGINPHTLSLVLEGKKNFSLKTVGKIAEALNLPAQDLICT